MKFAAAFICHSELVSESQIEQIGLIPFCYVKAMKRASKRGSLELRIAGSMKKIFNLYMY